jgi:hypothetical protein
LQFQEYGNMANLKKDNPNAIYCSFVSQSAICSIGLVCLALRKSIFTFVYLSIKLS